MKILVVEDEQELRTEIEDFLSGRGYLVETAANFNLAEDKLALYNYEAILLDVGLPGGSGLALLEMLKQKDQLSAVIIISAKDSLDDKITGLELGADDYLTKPFHLAELNARLLALLRRKKFQGNTILKMDELEVDTDARLAKVKGNPLDLTKKEFDLLQYFAINANRVLSKQAIVEHLWGDDYDTADNFDFIYVHIKNLRKKIKGLGGADYFSTVYGLGYKFSTP